MKTKIVYIERQPSEAVSIEKVFRQVALNLPKEIFTIVFQSLKYSNGTLGTLKNLMSFRPLTADIYHVTGHVHYIALLLPRGKTILTIHDAGILHIRKGLRRFVLKKLLFDFPIRKLKYITVVSEATKEEIKRFTNCDERKLRVIENPLQEHLVPEKKRKFNSECPRILQIGTTDNKNLPNLIKAIEGIKCRLVIIGTINSNILNLLKEKNIKFENRANLSNEEIKREYIEADLLSFCSTFEGFGLPIIEAQAMHTPVVTSNISPLKEVAGRGAILIEPYDYKSIRDGILSIVNDVKMREELITEGLENIKKYQPHKIAAMYQTLYNEVLTAQV